MANSQTKQVEKTSPDFAFETEARRQGLGPIAGIDEAGRGPWAGPVVAAAVILDPRNIPAGLDDSKRLSAEKREVCFAELANMALWAVGIATVEEIDRLNILQASLLAMRRAVDRLPKRPGIALIDGNRSPLLDCRTRAIVKGDQKSLSIAAASIVAKVQRDRMMVRLAEQHPEYGWDRNKGYGTNQHQRALAAFGVTPHHRQSFKPIHKILYQDTI